MSSLRCSLCKGPRKPVASKYGPPGLNNGLLWGIVAWYLGYLAFDLNRDRRSLSPASAVEHAFATPNQVIGRGQEEAASSQPEFGMGVPSNSSTLLATAFKPHTFACGSRTRQMPKL